MTNYDNIDDILGGNEQSEQIPENTPYLIHVSNTENNKSVSVDVYAENTLGQISQVVKGKIGLGDSNKLVFENKKLGRNTADSNLTLAAFGIGPEDALHINPDGGVA